MLSDEELYAGFAKDEIESIKEEWAKVKAEGEAVDEAAADAMRRGEAPESSSARAVMARKFEHLRHFYEPSAEMFAGLGRMYAEDGRFRTRYEAMAPGLADYLREAMEAYARGG
jgi:MerR family transcriptional regulator, thiopeptide resistance regulator